MIKYFDFEKSIEDIDKKIQLLEKENNSNNDNLIEKLQKEKDKLFVNIYRSLNSWQRVSAFFKFLLAIECKIEFLDSNMAGIT